MEIQFYGANCVGLATKKATVVIDDNLAGLGLKGIAKNNDIVIFTGPASELKIQPKLVIDQPGEYEVSDVSVQGIGTRGHMDEPGEQTATIFKIVGEDIRIAVAGHIYPELSDSQLEALGTIDVLVIPVGGNGYTLDSQGALALIKKIEPKIIIPTHYADKAIGYEVPQQSLEDALKGLAMEPHETVSKLKLKAGEIDEVTRLILLERV